MNFGFEAIISILFLLFSSSALFFFKDNLDKIISVIICALLTIILICKMVSNSAEIKDLTLVISIYVLVVSYLLLKPDSEASEDVLILQKIKYAFAFIIFLAVFIAAIFLSQNITQLSTISEKQKLAQKDDKFLNSFKNSSFGIAISEVGGSVLESKSKQDQIAKKNRGEFKMNQTKRETMRSDLSNSFLLKGFSEFILLLVAFFSLNLIRKAKAL